MTDIKGNRLRVNLVASQVWRWLKGHGFGVRKVFSDGKNRAMSINTATGGSDRIVLAYNTKRLQLLSGYLLQPMA
jgi:hypothetical protein